VPLVNSKNRVHKVNCRVGLLLQVRFHHRSCCLVLLTSHDNFLGSISRIILPISSGYIEMLETNGAFSLVLFLISLSLLLLALKNDLVKPSFASPSLTSYLVTNHAHVPSALQILNIIYPQDQEKDVSLAKRRTNQYLQRVIIFLSFCSLGFSMWALR
jgi:hypothetical protein